MLFYLAGRFSRRFEFQGYRRDLKLMGHDCTARWIDTSEDDYGADAAKRDIDDIALANGIVCFTEEPRKTATRGGRHVEFGMAVAMHKRLIVVGHRENVFYFLPSIEFCVNWSEAIEALRN